MKKFPSSFTIQPEHPSGLASIRLTALNSLSNPNSKQCSFAQPIKIKTQETGIYFYMIFNSYRLISLNREANI